MSELDRARSMLEMAEAVFPVLGTSKNKQLWRLPVGAVFVSWTGALKSCHRDSGIRLGDSVLEDEDERHEELQ